MTERPGPEGPEPPISPEELAWAAANLSLVRRVVSGPRFLYETLVIAFVIGLAAHVSGYVLAASGSGEPIGLLADLLTNFGIALWTGGVLVVFVQILPEVRRRWAAHRLEEYEAALREPGRVGTGSDDRRG